MRLACACLAVAVAAASGVACRTKPAAGRRCFHVEEVSCTAPDRALVCEGTVAGAEAQDGTWREVGCKGARGCARRGAADECDDTVAADDDPCPRGPPLDYACSRDGTRALACTDGSYRLWRACRGADGCRIVDGRNIQCDTSLGEPGDPCGQRGTYACSADRTTLLTCDGGALQPASSCRGPDACHIQREGHRVDCDDAVATVGDPCDQPARIACSTDHMTELVCTAGKYEKKRVCRRTACRLEGSELYCD